MAYIINLTDGTQLVNVADGTIDNTSSSLTLVGKNYAGYGEFLNENFIKLLENTANGSAPTAPLTGQLWYDTLSSAMKLWNGSAWRNLATSTTSATAPASPVTGEVWFDQVNGQLKVYDGSTFIVVGPAVSSELGETGALAETVLDNLGGEHIIVRLSADTQTIAVLASESFTPATGALPGFASINTGLNMNQSLGAKLSTNGISNNGSAGTGDIGSSSVPFATVYAQATSAQYADLAERYAADQAYEPGTVVELGGSAEITAVKDDRSVAVLGVVSTNPAYLMNEAAGDDATHPAVAVSGRVPVKVIGEVAKGDRLISAGNGMARAAKAHELTPYNVIGRALETKTTTNEGMIEAVVRINI